MRARSHRGLLAAFAVSLLWGCIHEDMPPCATTHALYICVDTSGTDFPEEPPLQTVDTAALFVFDGQGILRDYTGIGRAALANGEPVEIRYCGSCRPRVVAWGNLETCAVTLPVVDETTFGDFRVCMRSDGAYAAVPDNLYYGIRELTCETTQYILITPAMGRLTITARGLSREAGESYFFLVETQVDGYDFLRRPLRGKRVLQLDASRRENTGDLTTGAAVPLFAYPEEHDFLAPLRVLLYRRRKDGAQLVGQTDFDDKSGEIIPHAGRCVHVMMDFRAAAGIRVDIRISEWGVVELWEDW